jgi:hypothetical protein
MPNSDVVSLVPVTEAATTAFSGEAPVLIAAGSPAAILGRNSVQDATTADKVRLGIPTVVSGVSRSQCKLAVTISSSSSSSTSSGGKSGRCVATLTTMAGAKVPVCIRRGKMRKLVQPSESFKVKHDDIIEFGGSTRKTKKIYSRCVHVVSRADEQHKTHRSSTIHVLTAIEPLASPLDALTTAVDVWEASTDRVYKYRVVFGEAGAADQQAAPGSTPSSPAAPGMVLSPSFSSSSSSSSSSLSSSNRSAGKGIDKVAMPPPSPRLSPAASPAASPATTPVDVDGSSSSTTTTTTTSASASPSAKYTFKFKVRDLVDVKRRKGAGQNKEGGRARVTKVHPPSHRTGGYESYDVRYVLGGGENKLSPDVLTLAPADDEEDGNDANEGHRSGEQVGGRSPARSRRARAAKSPPKSEAGDDKAPASSASAPSSQASKGAKSGNNRRQTKAPGAKWGSGGDGQEQEVVVDDDDDDDDDNDDEAMEVDIDSKKDEELFFGFTSSSSSSSNNNAPATAAEATEGVGQKASAEAVSIAEPQVASPTGTMDAKKEESPLVAPAAVKAESLVGIDLTYKFRGYGTYKGKVTQLLDGYDGACDASCLPSQCGFILLLLQSLLDVTHFLFACDTSSSSARSRRRARRFGQV